MSDKVKAVANKEILIAAAYEWWSDRTPRDEGDALFLKALWDYEGDRTEPCNECEGQCGEPCAPCTVAEAHAGITASLAYHQEREAKQKEADQRHFLTALQHPAAIAAAEARGRREGIEASATLVENWGLSRKTGGTYVNGNDLIARDIRLLADAAPRGRDGDGREEVLSSLES